MFRIGDFSRVARVSCRLLRYYDEIGLLRPASTETQTGYRYYTAAQLPRLNRILVLKELGLSLDEIMRVVDDNISAAELRGMLLMKRTEIERALSVEAERLRFIETRIAQIDNEGQLSADDVMIRTEPAQRILSMRQTMTSFVAVRQLIGELHQTVRGRVPREQLGPFMAIAHAGEFEPDQLDVELGFVISGDAPKLPAVSGLALSVHELPQIERLATCVRIGLPEHAHLITGRIGRFVEANGYRLAGPSREVFLQPPRPDRMDSSVVEMQFPIEKAPAISS